MTQRTQNPVVSALSASLARIKRSASSAVAQVTLEYFILFAVVALVTVIGLTTFDDDIRTSLEGFVNAAANKIAN